MSTVEIPLNSYTYRFRKLTFEEEFALEQKSGEDAATTILIAALSDVSGQVLADRGDARRILMSLPRPVRARIWVLYKAGLPEDRFFTTKGLYAAPEPSSIVRRVRQDEDQTDAVADRAFANLEKKFSAEDLAATREVEQRLIEDARRRGALRPATKGDNHG